MRIRDERIEFLDDQPDELGRRLFFLVWVDEGGVFRPELSQDGQPVGFRRAQIFRTDPARFFARGVRVARKT